MEAECPDDPARIEGGSVTVLFLSDISWHSLTQRPQHIARRLALRSPVLWIEPITLGHPWSVRPRLAGPGLQVVSVPQLPLNARAAWMRSLARALSAVAPLRTLLESVQAAVVRRALHRLGWNGEPPAALVQNFQLIGLLARLAPGSIVFDYIDDAFGFSRLPALAERQWQETVRRANRIAVTAPRLRQLIERTEAGSRAVIRLIPNGVEYDRFASERPAPADLPADAPILCYVGSVYPWLDMELLEVLVRRAPETRLVIIGRSHPDVVPRLRALEKNPNFLYLGSRPYEEIPAYLHAAAAGIIPFRRTRLTESVNPVKLYEYCAAGLPTISTAFSDDLQAFRDTILIARTHEEFLSLVPRALAQSGEARFRERLRAFARDNDWDSRASAIAELLAESRAETTRGSHAP